MKRKRFPSPPPPPKKNCKPLSLAEFCVKSKMRYERLVEYEALHKFSIVRQIIDSIVDDAFNKAYFVGAYDDTVSIKSDDQAD